MSGNAMTVAAITHPSHVCTTLKIKLFKQKFPKRSSPAEQKKQEETGHCRRQHHGQGENAVNDRLLSRRRLNYFLAANIPRKNEINVATTPVFSDIKSGLQSRSFTICMISSITSPFVRYFIYTIASYLYIRIKIVGLKYSFRFI